MLFRTMAVDANAANWSPVSFLDFFAKHADDVPHVAQSKVWDCGIACTEMVLRARGAKDVSHSPHLNVRSVLTVTDRRREHVFLFLSL